MWLSFLSFGLGLLALYFGAEWLVRGSARLARSFGISALAVGLTVVAFGTSMPELVVSALAAIRDQPNVSAGNVVGSNIFNLAAILGISAVIHPMRVEARLIVREMPLMIAAAILAGALALDQALGRGDGLLLLAAFVGYIVFVLYAAREAPARVEGEFREYERAERLDQPEAPRWQDTALIAVGLTVLVGGAHLLVSAAVAFALALGVSDLVIGLTIVAAGTSLPELATSAMAAFRKEPDIAVGNIVGSNIFNCLAILGFSATVHPLGVAAPLLRVDIPIMIGLSILVLALAHSRLRIARLEGALLLAAYMVFTWVVLTRGTAGPA